MIDFLNILNGSKSKLVIHEGKTCMAIIEEKPLVLGHSVVFPKRVVDSWMDLTDEELTEVMLMAKKVGQAIEQTVECKKIGVAVIGLQVKHAHVHLVPIQTADDLNFTRSKLDISESDLLEMAIKIRSKL